MSVQPPHPPFSPGRAKVRATVEKIVANDEDVHLYIVVDRTLEYGPATPSLPGGQSVKVDASTFEKNAGEKFRTLKEGEQFTLLIGYTRSLGNESRNWTLQQIETDSTNN